MNTLPAGSTAAPVGSSSSALVAAPVSPAKPAAPLLLLPASVVIAPCASEREPEEQVPGTMQTKRIALLSMSAMYRLPP